MKIKNAVHRNSLHYSVVQRDAIYSCLAKIDAIVLRGCSLSSCVKRNNHQLYWCPFFYLSLFHGLVCHIFVAERGSDKIPLQKESNHRLLLKLSRNLAN